MTAHCFSGIVSIGKMIRTFYKYISPRLEEHKATLVKEQPRDFIDRYLTEIHVSGTTCTYYFIPYMCQNLTFLIRMKVPLLPKQKAPTG